ncbi:hypothetical protein O1M54_14400 [Streptomyces diastatochromogenes]|nr:hypothetical protein [Streptomyces diastatochromogenes]
MRHRRALLPAFAVTALLLAAGCSSPAPHAAPPAAGQGQDVRATDGPSSDTDHSLTVAAAPPPPRPPQQARPAQTGGRTRPRSPSARTTAGPDAPSSPRHRRGTGLRSPCDPLALLLGGAAQGRRR